MIKRTALSAISFKVVIDEIAMVRNSIFEHDSLAIGLIIPDIPLIIISIFPNKPGLAHKLVINWKSCHVGTIRKIENTVAINFTFLNYSQIYMPLTFVNGSVI